MDSWLKHYIPAGCLRIGADDIDLPLEAWTPPNIDEWCFFRNDKSASAQDELFLPEHLRLSLLSSSSLVSSADLFHARWIQLSFSKGIVRVYIFPHDVDRRAIERPGDAKLSRSLAVLLKSLDYSPRIWNGSVESAPWKYPAASVGGAQVVDEDIPLLDQFNQLPSPEPKIDLVTPGSFNAIAMQGILDSQLPGLHTTLFAHQRRSAAVMLQREVEPSRVLDPRLRSAVDQRQEPWYFDADVGLVLKEPRFYDGVSGGILAEEMGTGKTLICLALILATKHMSTEPPDALSVEIPKRDRVGSLVDMAAAAVNRHSFPWRAYLASSPQDPGQYVENCARALKASRNWASYELGNPLVETRKCDRVATPRPPAAKIYLSNCSLIIAPNNLVTQWQEEILKHTSGLKYLLLTDSKAPIPPLVILMRYDIILFSQARFESLERARSSYARPPHCPIDHIRFKRCIIDEGHKLGSSRGSAWKSDLMRGLDRLHLAARWVVTGTPARGLYGVANDVHVQEPQVAHLKDVQATNNQERDDLQRIGSIATKFLKVRPWSNTREEVGDTPASWNVYIMQPRHHNKSSGRTDCLKATLESLIIRNRLSDVSHILPPTDEKIVVLDGSFQDKLSLNLFSMMIIFNSVQSQRTDQDYFFHPKQRKALDQLVSNMKQASFFGGVFYSPDDIQKSLDTAQKFLEEKKVPISQEDHALIEEAMTFGRLALDNGLKCVSNQYHSMPIYVEHFPGGNGKHWSLDDADTNAHEPVCTDATLLRQLQKFLNPCIDAPTSLKMMIENGQLDTQGDVAREQTAKEAAEAEGNKKASSTQSSALAGNTTQGVDRHKIRNAGIPSDQVIADLTTDNTDATSDNIEIAEPLAKTHIISTVSAKLSYLIDSIVRYQDDEQIIVFYENDNVAWYLAGALEILQIQHLIYTRKGLDSKRRAQYVSTFTHNPKFRVLLMDISQAAFGLDMRSASRIYFVSPVLNPQVEAQAVGRARRISSVQQQKPVTVETLVLRDSIEEVLVQRRRDMTQAEHRRVKSILDDGPMHDWIRDARILRMPDLSSGDHAGVAQTARLKTPQFVFGRGFGRDSDDPDADLVMDSPTSNRFRTRPDEEASQKSSVVVDRLAVPIKLGGGGLKRSRTSTPVPGGGGEAAPGTKKVKKSVRVAFADDD